MVQHWFTNQLFDRFISWQMSKTPRKIIENIEHKLNNMKPSWCYQRGNEKDVSNMKGTGSLWSTQLWLWIKNCCHIFKLWAHSDLNGYDLMSTCSKLNTHFFCIRYVLAGPVRQPLQSELWSECTVVPNRFAFLRRALESLYRLILFVCFLI